MVKISNFCECTLQQALTVWNEGFQGYFSDMTFTMDRLVARFGQEGISPEASVLAWVSGRPVGFILSGIRTIQGKRIAWNGGTGVVPDYRRQGVGRQMVEACLDVYRTHQVDTAYLEAMVQNTAAIALYQQVGYSIVDHITFLTFTRSMSNTAFSSIDLPGHTVRLGLPHEVGGLSFYQAFAPWQTQWQSVLGGRSAILFDKSGLPIAYALYKHSVDEDGKLTSMALYQCEVNPGIQYKAAAIRRLLREVYAPLDFACRRLTINIPTSNESLIQALETEGFTTLSEQVFMKCEMKG